MIKKILAGSLIILVIAVILIFVQSDKPEIMIKDGAWQVEIADTDALREQGLSGRTSLDEKEAMLFVFETVEAQIFWMKDMKFALDIIFLDENLKIIAIEKNLAPETYPKTFGWGLRTKYVLEINANQADFYKLAIGDQAAFKK